MNLSREKRLLARICVDKDVALAKSTDFCKYIRDDDALNLEATGGYASYLNDKVEQPNHTIAERVCCCFLNAACPKQDRCYAAQHSADLYRLIHHSALDMSPF
jgi:hypothetical protein